MPESLGPRVAFAEAKCRAWFGSKDAGTGQSAKAGLISSSQAALAFPP